MTDCRLVKVAAILASMIVGQATASEIPAHLSLLADIATQGDADAQFMLGQLYRDPDNDYYDPKRAMYWLDLSAQQAHAHASEAVGEMFWRGSGVEQDFEQAMRWLKKAAEMGLMSAIDSVGWMHWLGKGGVEHDCGQALSWFERALQGGYDPSRNNMAWVLATCPDPKHRDGRRSLRLAREHVYEYGEATANTLDTLAAAYAEAGDFVTAVEVQQRAIDAADPSQVNPFIERLEAYQRRQAWVEGPQ